ncbi:MULTISPECIES: histidine kinase [unclassified Myroides]|uniref:sensor histidine kinase n=1 Tax=unclassified Myroides TaxID=2642485 RepID=UPI0015FC25FD|nr:MULTISPECIES: histidine kinase [unclassified Myroides]MBB1149342.1 histidine kinase [Myroides sp. NP-2]MDM1406753.1 histidine kinase [Myroides sp. DF42-4-2]
MRDFLERKWAQELGILVFSFILFTLNDWILIASWRSLFLGLVYFMLLYAHAQLNRFYLLPLLVKRDRIYLYLFLTLCLLSVTAFFLSHLTQSFLYKSCFLHSNNSKLTFQYQLGVLLGSNVCILGTTHFLEYYRKQKEMAHREIITKKNEIDLLNKQLNPHFLFNTLNTIYGLSIAFPDKTPDAIMKVSELLRYQVENSNKDVVALSDEISFIQSYIELEQERVGYRCDLRFRWDIDQANKYTIAPLIVFTFVENAFKHGTSTIEHCFIHIDLHVNQGVLQLDIVNPLPLKSTAPTSTKVGLENTTARLQMIYPNRHTLRVYPEGNQFITHLSIDL